MSGGMRTSILAGAVIVACYGVVLTEKKDDKVADANQNPPAALPRERSEESERVARLEKQENIVRARIDFARRIARELIAQRLTLVEAATQLHDLDSSLAPVHRELYATAFVQLYPGRSEGERYCQRAIALVENEFPSKPPHSHAILRRLQDELRHELNGGILQLPH